MTEQPTRHQNFLSIREKFAQAPEGADANGFTDADRARDAAIAAHVLGHDQEPAPEALVETEPAARLKPNPAQGSSSSTPAVRTGGTGSLRDRMRAHAQAALEAGDGAA